MSLYDDLGVSKNATEEEIKRAHRRGAAKHHPDKGGSAEKFHAVQKAYEVLIDPKRRKRYDAGGEESPEQPAEAIAMQNLAALVMQAVDTMPSVEHYDLMSNLRTAVVRGNGEIAKRLAAQKKAKIKYEAVLKRVKKKGEGQPVIERVLERRISETVSAIEDTEKAVKAGEIMMELLEGYSYEFEERLFMNLQTFTTSSTGGMQ